MAENKYEGVKAPYGDKGGPGLPVGTSAEYLQQQLDAHGEAESVDERQHRLEAEAQEREHESHS